jgi:hypothetical protein
MKRIVVTILSLALGLSVVAACGGNACEDAFSKSKKCVASADCTQAGNTQQIAACNVLKNIYGALEFNQACQTLPNSDCSCTSSTSQAAADKILKCANIDSAFPACMSCLQ